MLGDQDISDYVVSHRGSGSVEDRDPKVCVRSFFNPHASKTRNSALRPFNTEEAMGHLLYVDLLIRKIRASCMSKVTFAEGVGSQLV